MTLPTVVSHASTAPSSPASAQDGKRFDLRLWLRMQSLFIPSVSVLAVLRLHAAESSAEADVLQLYTWERDRLLTLAKGLGAAAVTVLAALIADATEGSVKGPAVVAAAAGVLVILLLLWAGFLLTGLRRLAEQYALALLIVKT